MTERAWIRAGLLLLTLLVYGRTLQFGFVRLDDPAYVSENPHVLGGPTPENLAWAFTTTHRSNWHPLTWISLMLDAEIGGSRPAVYHATNVLLHLVNVLLLFQVLLRATRLPWRSACAAALFAIHPLHVESVAWVTERKDVLSTAFFLLALLAHVRFTQAPGTVRYLAIVAFFILGLLSKPMVVTLPLVLLLLDFWPLGRAPSWRSFPRLLWEKAPLFLLAAASSAMTLYAQSRGGAVQSLEHFTIGTRLANAVVSCALYLAKTLWPARLAVPYPYDAGALGSLPLLVSSLVLLAVTALAIYTIRSRPYLLMGWLWYAITLIPVLGLVQVGTQPMADRYTYIPLIGAFIALTWGCADLTARSRSWRIVGGSAASAALAALAWVAFVQTGVWRDSRALATHALRVTTRNATAENILGLELDDEGRLQDAIEHYRAAVRFSSRYLDAMVNLASALARTGQLEEAMRSYGEVLRISSDHLLARKGLGSLLAQQQGREAEALVHLQAALSADPVDVPTRVNLAAVLLRQGRLDEAESELREAIRRDPASSIAHTNLGSLLARSQRVGEAVRHFAEAVRLDPQNTRAREYLERASRLAGSGSEKR